MYKDYGLTVTAGLISLSMGFGACKAKKDIVTQEAPQSANSAVLLDYPSLYCEHVGRLKLRTDVSKELNIFCLDGKPTQQLLDFRSKSLSAEPGKIDIVTLEIEQNDEKDSSRFVIAWSFHVPIRPFVVKSRPIYEYIARTYQTETIKFTGNSQKRKDDPLDSGLHLWSVDMNYALEVKGTSGITLNNTRKTQYNLYQVQSGNEEMGFGVEHLVDGINPDFTRSTMLNLSFNDGKGYNDGQGGAVVVTVLQFEVNNQGFPATAKQSVLEIAQYIANGMYEGLKQ